MNRIRSAMLAASAIACLAASAAPAQAQRYFARERLMINDGSSNTSPTNDPTPTPTPAPTVYNNNNHGAQKNTKNINGCGFSNDATSNGFATANDALDWCSKVKVMYPNQQVGYMYCTLVILGDGKFQASMGSSACKATFSGSQIWPNGTSQGHWEFTAIPSAYK